MEETALKATPEKGEKISRFFIHYLLHELLIE